MAPPEYDNEDADLPAEHAEGLDSGIVYLGSSADVGLCGDPRKSRKRLRSLQPRQESIVTRWSASSVESSRSVRIELPPGTRTARALGIVLTRRAYRRWVYPALVEMQAEYFEAVQSGYLWQARWIHFRGLFLLVPGWVWAIAGRTLRQWLRLS